MAGRGGESGSRGATVSEVSWEGCAGRLHTKRDGFACWMGAGSRCWEGQAAHTAVEAAQATSAHHHSPHSSMDLAPLESVTVLKGQATHWPPFE